VKRVRVVVSGRVQGVFFRATCARRARALGLGGSVRNMPDGSVEAVFEGPSADVEAMVAWCRSGPELARVDEVEVHEEPLTGIRTFG
jgi:acylphosphatase